MLQKISTFFAQMDWHLFALFSVAGLICVLFISSRGKRKSTLLNTRELLSELNPSKQDFDHSKEDRTVSMLETRHQMYLTALLNRRFSQQYFLVHLVAYFCIDNYRSREDVTAFNGYVVENDEELKNMFALIARQITSYEQYSHMIQGLKRSVGDIRKANYIAHGINTRLSNFLPDELLEKTIILIEGAVIQEIQYSLQNKQDLHDIYDDINEEDKLYCKKIFDNDSLKNRIVLEAAQKVEALAV